MKTVLVIPENNMFRAVSGEKKSYGKTVGQAVDALTEQFENGDNETLYILQRFQPDEFFTAEQQKRLSTLMDDLRAAQNQNEELESEKKAELESLIAAELEGSAKRSEKIFNDFGK